MFSLSRRLIQLRKFASCVLLALVVYQLGACPCGCVEHNAWLQVLGVSDHSHAEVAVDTEDAISISGDHDCSGEHVVAYMDNARPVPSNEIGSQFLTCLLVAPESASEAVGSGRSFFTQSDCLAFARALDRPALQVYRL